ncbi:MAG: glucose-6-phosphate isomerase, partial [Pseudobdellovibrionaceae bacterium]
QTIGQNLRIKYSNLVLVGIGGSSLGPKAIAEIFRATNIHFLDNVDAVEFERLMENIDLTATCWVFISKSGNTIEILCALDLIQQVYKDKSINFYDRCVAITENKPSSLKNWADKHNVIQAYIPLDVGGRFSVLSPVGMIPAAFIGLNVNEFCFGALQALQSKNLVSNVVAQVLESFKREEWITLFWPYCSRLRYFGMWYQQLWAESLGKKSNLQGLEAPRASTPMCATGATDQHSILQQVMEGAKDKFILFLRVLDSEKGSLQIHNPQFTETHDLKNRTMGELLKIESLATQEALNQNQTHSLTLQVPNLNAESVGYLFMFFQLVVSGLGQVMRIDTFNQPGVELGKIITKQKIATKKDT